MKKFHKTLFPIFIFISVFLFAEPAIKINTSEIITSGVPTELEIILNSSDNHLLKLIIDNSVYILEQDKTIITHTFKSSGSFETILEYSNNRIQVDLIHVIPGIISIVPPILAILVALIFRQVIPALFIGIWFGAWAVNGMSINAIFTGLLASFDRFILEGLVPADGSNGHASLIMFSMMLGGMVGVITKNGGAVGIVNLLKSWANNSKRGQLATAIFGTVFFIDDYANTLIVGNTLKPLTDKLKISREKLAYIVDSTAAPVACLALISTWIGYEVGLISDSIDILSIGKHSAYGLFLHSLKFSFYPILAICFVFMVATSGRDFGPMIYYEKKAKNSNVKISEIKHNIILHDQEMLPKDGVPERAFNAIIPFGLVIISTVVGLYYTGDGDTLQDIIGSADSYSALMWSSLIGVLSVLFLTIIQKILTLEECIQAWFNGVKSMLLTMIILILAWSLSGITDVLHTADFIVSILGSYLKPELLPSIVFIISAATAFSTGTSWGTMGILMPLTIPLTWSILITNDMTNPENFSILYASISSVLCGSVWGDHCSPISDTTILSSLASGCDHLNHVKTQLPYAFLVGGVSIVFCSIPSGFGVPWWLCLIFSTILLWFILKYFGKKNEI